MKAKKIITIISIALVIGLIVGLGATWYIHQNDKKTNKDLKEITIVVEDSNGKEKMYTTETKAKYFSGAMEDTEGLTFEGTSGEYGLMITTINGLVADYNTDSAYWAFYLNGSYCEYGIDEQPVSDGDIFRIEYTKDK
jgi:hypothetical protein